MWYLLQGRGDPALGTLTPLGPGKIPAQLRQPVTWDNKAYFLSKDQEAICILHPDGRIDDSSLAHLSEIGYEGTGAVEAYGLVNPAVSSKFNTILQVADTNPIRTYEYANDVWTEGVYTLTGTYPVRVGSLPDDNAQYFATWDGANWLVHYREGTTQSSQPNYTTTSWADHEEVSSQGILQLPRLFDPTRQVRIKRVILDGWTWEPAGHGLSTQFSPPVLAVVAIKPDTAEHNFTLGPSTTPLSGQSSGTQEHIRVVATPGDMLPFLSYYDMAIRFEGMALEAVTVEFEISDGMIQ